MPSDDRVPEIEAALRAGEDDRRIAERFRVEVTRVERVRQAIGLHRVKGRPRRQGEQHSRRFSMLFTPAERAELDRGAEADGTTVAEHIRRRLFGYR